MRKFEIMSIFLLSFSGASGQTPNRNLDISHLTGDFYIYTTYGSFKNAPLEIMIKKVTFINKNRLQAIQV
jgi:metallo-beta-lactamase class B